MAFCPYCGTAAQQDAGFCVRCGKSLPKASQATADPATRGQSRQHSACVTLKSLSEAGCLEVAQILDNEIGRILMQVGDSPLPANTGYAILSWMSPELLMLFCWERRPVKGYECHQTGTLTLKREGTRWR